MHFFDHFIFQKQYNTMQFFRLIFFENNTLQFNFFDNLFRQFFFENNTIQFLGQIFLTNFIKKTIQYNATLLIGKLEISIFFNNTIHSNELKFNFFF